MTVQVPEEKIQEQVDKRLKSMALKVKLDGFRPGKAPHGLMQKRYGKGVRDEVLAELIQSSFSEALREEKLKPVAGPLITHQTAAEGEGLTYVADFEVMPEFVLYPFEHMEVERFVSEVTDEDLEEMVLRLRDQRKIWHATGNPAALGDRLIIHFEGQVEGENFTNGKVENFPVEIGSKGLVEGFENELIGCMVGSKKTFSVQFPEDYVAEDLKGKIGEFSVEVVSVEEGALPDMDAEFVKTFGIESGEVDDFRVEIKASMEREMNRALHAKNKNVVMEELLRRNDSLGLPSVLVNQELTSLINAFKSEAEKRKQPVDEAVAREHFGPVAKRRVTLGLLFTKITETNQVILDSVRVRRMIEDISLSYENPEEIVNWYYSDRAQLGQVQNLVIEDQIVDIILARAKITEQRIGFKELMQPASQSA